MPESFYAANTAAPTSTAILPPAVSAPDPRPVKPRNQKQTWTDPFGALALVLAVALVPSSYVALRFALANLGQDVPATIVSRSISKGRSGIHYTVNFKYEVNGQHYTGSQDIDSGHFYNPSLSNKVTIRRMHMVGVEWNALFDMGSTWWRNTWFAVGIAAIMTALGGVMFYVCFLAPIRRRRFALP